MTKQGQLSAIVLGATGYAGSELVKLLSHHPRVRITAATARGDAGRPLREVHRSAPALKLSVVEEVDFANAEAVFSCFPHGESAPWIEKARAAGARVVDLSADLRVPERGNGAPAGAVYGLTELHRERIQDADVVANPGCYPTGALLALAPLLRRGLVAGPVVINAASGVSGAGRSPKRELLFGEVAGDFRAYAAGNEHRHLRELRDQVERLAGADAPDLVFAPHLLPVARGILETLYVPLHSPLPPGRESALWQDDYTGEPFVEVLASGMPALRDVVGTNRAAIGVTSLAGLREPMVMIVAVLDNLLKGAAGQAVQNLNRMMGWPETEALPC